MREGPINSPVIVLSLWSVSMLLSLYIMLSYAFEVQFIHGVACLPDNNQTNLVVPVRYTFLVTWIVFGGLMPLTVTINVRIVCLCYIRRNIATEGTEYRKGMAKLSLFLIVGGSINFLVRSFLAYRLCTLLHQECISAMDLQ